jgi:hypothetical protein
MAGASLLITANGARLSFLTANGARLSAAGSL